MPRVAYNSKIRIAFVTCRHATIAIQLILVYTILCSIPPYSTWIVPLIYLLWLWSVKPDDLQHRQKNSDQLPVCHAIPSNPKTSIRLQTWANNCDHETSVGLPKPGDGNLHSGHFCQEALLFKEMHV